MWLRANTKVYRFLMPCAPYTNSYNQQYATTVSNTTENKNKMTEEIKQIDYLIIYKDYIIYFVGILFAVLSYIIKIQYEKIKDVKSKLSQRKYELYEKVYSVLFKLIEKEKISKSKSKSKESIESLILDIKKEMFIYAPDKILKKFLNWSNNTEQETNEFKRIQSFNELLILIRKDMGNHRTRINKDDVMRSILSSEEEFIKFKAQVR